MRYLSSRSVVLAVAACVHASLVPGAEEEVAPELGTVEVIGTRVPAALAQTSDTVAGEELFIQHRDDLSRALELVPGVSIQNVGQRRERLMYLRGFNSRQVPLFIDGVPVYVPYDGNVDLARFGVDYVSEIRVGKGLASLLYGPNIMGGAINVVSRRPTEPFSVSARLSTEVDDEFDNNLLRGALLFPAPANAGTAASRFLAVSRTAIVCRTLSSRRRVARMAVVATTLSRAITC